MEDLRRRLADKELDVTLTDRARDYVVDQAFDPAYGARPLKRFLQSRVETLIARKMIAGEIAPRSTIVVDYDGKELTASSQK
jgi:ATP-dependent Clp protease ATP-binding subunit ClpB